MIKRNFFSRLRVPLWLKLTTQSLSSPTTIRMESHQLWENVGIFSCTYRLNTLVVGVDAQKLGLTATFPPVPTPTLVCVTGRITGSRTNARILEPNPIPSSKAKVSPGSQNIYLNSYALIHYCLLITTTRNYKCDFISGNSSSRQWDELKNLTPLALGSILMGTIQTRMGPFHYWAIIK